MLGNTLLIFGTVLLILGPFWLIWGLVICVWWRGYRVPPHPLPQREPYPFRLGVERI
jgi:hypothetical protein